MQVHRSLANVICWITLAVCLRADALTTPQPWAASGQWLRNVTQGGFTGPIAVDSKGDLLVASVLVGVSNPTKVLGDASAAFEFVSKVDSASNPMFGVQIGGVYVIDALATDNAGNVLIAGHGPAGGLPVTPEAYSKVPSGDQSAFVCKLNGADGTAVFCTYLNSNQLTIAGIAADANGDVYILAGQSSPQVPTTPGALSLGNQTIVLLKLDPTGTHLLYAAALGGSGGDGPLALSVDGTGNAYVLGATSSTDFPGTSQGAISAPGPDFIAKVDPSGAKILYATYGRPQELGEILAVDSLGAVYLSGISGSGGLFVRKYTADGTAVAYETALPGTNGGDVAGMAVDDAGTVTLLGNAGSIVFPQLLPTAACQAMTETYPTASPGAFMIRLASDGSLFQSTYFHAEFVFTPPGSGGVLAAQADRAWLAVAARALNAAGVVQIGPALAPVSPIDIQCASNAATFSSGNVAPGEIISIFGTGLGPATSQTWMLDAAGRIASALAGVQVTFDGIAAPLLYVQDQQINAITPWELAGKTSTQMCVSYSGEQDCAQASVGPAAPGVFTVTNGFAAALNQDGTLNSPENPAPVGSIVSLFLTGLGAITPQVADGAIVQLPLPDLANSVAVSFANANVEVPIPIPADVLYAGPAPLQVGGLFQINVRVPGRTGTALSVAIAIPNGGTFYANAGLAIGP